MIKIAIADDHPLVIMGLDIMFANNDMELTGSYNNGRELLAGLKTTTPEILILDIHMPGQRGDELAAIITEQYPGIKILALTNEDNVYHIKNMQRKGVHGYILKTATESQLVEAIHAVYRGEHYLETILEERVRQDTLQAKKRISAKPVLTEREKEILSYISQDMTSQQIADKISLSRRTIEYFRVSMLTKLGVKNVGALVKKAIQLGLIE